MGIGKALEIAGTKAEHKAGRCEYCGKSVESGPRSGLRGPSELEQYNEV
jgi:hypothetical protein